MTRQEFDRDFSANTDNTAGYTHRTLQTINDNVFFHVQHMEIDDDGTKSIIDHLFERAFASVDVLDF